MKRTTRIIAWIVGVIALLILLLALVARFLIDPNDYRDQIAGLVERSTGRQLAIEGDLDLSVFPWLGLEVGQMRLSNAEGFGPEPFARIQEAEVRVKLLPLLRREVEIGTVVLEGLRLNLARTEVGQTNWDDLVQPAPEEDKVRGRAIGALAIGGIRLRDTHITWDDRLEGTQYTISGLELTSGPVDFDQPIPIELSSGFTASEPELTGDLSLRSVARIASGAERLSITGTELTLNAKGPMLPGGDVSARLSADVVVDLEAETLEVTDLVLTGLGLRAEGRVSGQSIVSGPLLNGNLAVTVADPDRLAPLLPKDLRAAGLKGSNLGSAFTFSMPQESLALPNLAGNLAGVPLKAEVKGEKLLAAPRLTGRASLDEFVPRRILEELGIALPESADPSVLGKAALTFGFDATATSAALSGLNLQVDDTRLTGRFAATRFDPPALSWDLTVDAINLDRYLPPPAEGEANGGGGTPAGAATAAVTELPLDLLRTLRADGTVRVGRLQAINLKSSDIVATLKAADGVLQLQPMGANLYGGRYAGNTRLDVRGDQPRFALNEKLEGVQAGPLLTDLMGEAWVTGTAHVSASLTGTGIDPDQVRRTVSGNGTFRFSDGTVRGINVAHLIRQARAAIRNEPAPSEEPSQTDFAELTGTLTVKDGLVSNNDLNAKSPLLRVTGQGTVNLVNEQVDYLVRTAIVGTTKGQAGKELEELKGLTIPVRITGLISEPRFRVDLEDLLKGRIEQEKERLEEKLEKRLEEGLKDELRGLFRR